MYIHSWMAEGSSYQTTRRTPISDTETKTNLIDNLYECKPVWNPVEAKRLFPKVQVPSPDSLNIFASFPWKTGWFHIKNHPETHENFHCELVVGVRRACFKFLGPTVHNLWRTKPKFSSTGHPQKWCHEKISGNTRHVVCGKKHRNRVSKKWKIIIRFVPHWLWMTENSHPKIKMHFFCTILPWDTWRPFSVRSLEICSRLQESSGHRVVKGFLAITITPWKSAGSNCSDGEWKVAWLWHA